MALVADFQCLHRHRLRPDQCTSNLRLVNVTTPNPVWSAAHDEFHAALVAACDSPWLQRIRKMLFVQSERYRNTSMTLNPSDRDIADEHRQIAEAALAHNPVAATEAMRRHLELTTNALLETLTIEPSDTVTGSVAQIG
ncbi:MAG: GntR family transcriptional regulator [Rhodobacteraceae bacterium]|nr:GntR family transcriptional regulator [Paracoccaceae bacterium]